MQNKVNGNGQNGARQRFPWEDGIHQFPCSAGEIEASSAEELDRAIEMVRNWQMREFQQVVQNSPLDLVQHERLHEGQLRINQYTAGQISGDMWVGILRVVRRRNWPGIGNEKIAVTAKLDVIRHQLASFGSRSDLFPSPEIFAQYSESVQEMFAEETALAGERRRQIQNNIADATVRSCDAEGKSIAEKIKKEQRAVRNQLIGQCLGFAVMLAVIGAATYLIQIGNESGAGLVVVLGSIAGFGLMNNDLIHKSEKD